MSGAYDRNIERLKANQSAVSQQEQKQILEAGEASARRRIKDANSIISGLEKLSPTLQKMHEERIEKLEEEGREAARQARESKLENMSENARKLQEIELAKSTGELAFEFEDAEAQELVYQQLKKELLSAGGPDSYYDAERLAQLSPHQQTGYAKEKLRMFQEAYPGLLQNELMNSTEVINLNGIKFTPAELRDNNLALPMKEAAINVMQRRILERSGIHQYSDEMLRLTKTNEVIAKAKESLMATHKSRYNIQSSQNIRHKANIQWDVAGRDPGGHTGEDLHLFLITAGNTVDNKNNVLGNAGGWDHVMSKLKSEGIANDDPALADRLGNLVIPDSLAIQVGAKKGSTYAQHWPGRFAQLKRDIKKGYSNKVKEELTYQKAEGVELQSEFIQAAKEAGGNGTTLSTQEVNEWKRKFGDIGLPVPESVTKYETASMRDEREDKQQIEALMAANNGVITDAQLDQFHPIAALEYREKAAKFERDALQAFDAEKKIKAHLDTAFTNMGIKGNEKSPAYVEAMANAKADYANKYNQYIGMGYTAEQASYLALHGQGVVDPETKEPIPDSMGVLAEIKANGEGSKYVVEGMNVERDIRAGDIRVARIASGKREIIDDPNIIINGTIGGAYGQKQLTSIIKNIEKHGVNKGLTIDKGAIQYYKGLASGRGGNWMGLLDAQLKANGHEGLWPKGKPEIQTFMEGKDENGEDLLSSDVEALRAAIARANFYPSKSTLLYQRNLMKDGYNYYQASPISAFDEQENLVPWIS